MRNLGFVVIVDDDSLNNFIVKQSIVSLNAGLPTKEFTNPAEGWKYISSLTVNSEEKVILFLDINMPGITGWDFLEKIETLPAEKKNALEVYILSSSLDESDMDRARMNFHVKAYYTKPIKMDALKKTLGV